jgi:hypothetical protein
MLNFSTDKIMSCVFYHSATAATGQVLVIFHQNYLAILKNLGQVSFFILKLRIFCHFISHIASGRIQSLDFRIVSHMLSTVLLPFASLGNILSKLFGNT